MAKKNKRHRKVIVKKRIRKQLHEWGYYPTENLADAAHDRLVRLLGRACDRAEQNGRVVVKPQDL